MTEDIYGGEKSPQGRQKVTLPGTDGPLKQRAAPSYGVLAPDSQEESCSIFNSVINSTPFLISGHSSAREVKVNPVRDLGLQRHGPGKLVRAPCSVEQTQIEAVLTANAGGQCTSTDTEELPTVAMMALPKPEPWYVES